MKRTLSHSGRRACARLLAKGYSFKMMCEGVAWSAPDQSCGCEISLALAVEKAKRHEDQVVLKARLEVAGVASYLLHDQRHRQITARLPG